MTESLLLLAVVTVFIILLAGAICGIAALVKVQNLRRELAALRAQLRGSSPADSRQDLAAGKAEPPKPGGMPPSPPRAVSEPTSEGETRQRLSPVPEFTPKGEARSGLSLEMLLGTRWMARVGMVMFLIGLAFLLRFAYDHALIGELGRLAIGCLAGAVALGAGEYMRRQSYNVLFQTLTGGGLAIFYICIYFAFGVYAFIGASAAMVLAVCITAASVVLAVGHNAMAIAVLGLIGGYISPLLFGGDENRPYALFTYIIVLNLVTLGVAYFRRWRAVDSLAFCGTVILYSLWYTAHFDSEQMVPALLFTTLFYLLFLLLPITHSLARRMPQRVEGVVLIGVNSAVWLLSYYFILNHVYDEYARPLGFIVLGQAVLVFAVTQVYRRRIPNDVTAAQGMLAITLVLITLAIPLQFQVYGIPIAWAAESVILAYLGLRYRNAFCQGAALVTLALAVAALINRLPLHEAAFTPIGNAPFASWALVIAGGAATAWLFHRFSEARHPRIWCPRELAGILAYATGCLLLTLEAVSFWQHHYAELTLNAVYRENTLTLLWSVIPLGTAAALQRYRMNRLTPLAWAAYAVGALVFLQGIAHYAADAAWFGGTLAFWSRAAFPISLYGALALARNSTETTRNTLETVANATIALLLTLECLRWAEATTLLSREMGEGMVSALWALHGAVLVWFGLLQRAQFRRILGFILFGGAVAKTVILDMQELDEVYRIVSFIGIGLLLLLAGYLYQRYSGRIMTLAAEKIDEESPSNTAE
ncbi:MAG: DUF2339 domain-containing protein [Candidatus Hydrogenedentota bacterium]